MDPGHQCSPAPSPAAWALELIACPIGAPGKKLAPKAGGTRYEGIGQREGVGVLSWETEQETASQSW